MSQYASIMEMLSRHNEGKIQLDEDEKEILAMQAKRLGEKFNVESRPLAKGAFDAADMAAFGTLPNKWRPRSAGQDLYGETGYDKVAGGVGSVAGLVTGAAGAVKGGKMGWAALKKAFARKKADDIATNVYKGNLIGRGSGPPLQLGQGTRQLGGRPLGLPGPGVGRPGQLPGPGVGRPGQITKGNPFPSNRSRELEEAINALRNNPEILRALGVQQGGYIGMQEGGSLPSSYRGGDTPYQNERIRIEPTQIRRGETSYTPEMINEYDRSGNLINAAGGGWGDDDDYSGHLMKKAGLSGHEGPWSGDVTSVTNLNYEERNNQTTRDDYERNTFSMEEGAPQGAWMHQSDIGGEIQDILQPMTPTINVHGKRRS